MKKTININFQGQLITIEETAYEILSAYIQSLKDYFRREADGSEIVNDIENRIAELFGNRLKHGIPCITDDDVTSVIDTIGRPQEFDLEFDEREEQEEKAAIPHPQTYSTQSQMPPPVSEEPRKSLYRKSNDRILGGVCSGLAHYLKIDPVFVRLGFVLLSSLFFWVYIIMWIVLPARQLPNNISKRLYRNPSDRFIAGVSGGIAAYFKIDTWIPRVIFLLPIILNVFGLARIPFNAFNNFIFSSSFPFNLSSSVNFSFVVIYIILWIIMPQATTVKQKLEMMGEEGYLQSIREKVSGNVAQARSSRAEMESANVDVSSAKTTTTTNSVTNQAASDNPADKQDFTAGNDDTTVEAVTPPLPPPLSPPAPPYIDGSRATYISPQPERSGCLTFIVGFLKVVFFGIVGVVAASLMVSLFGLLFAGAKFVPLQSLFINPGFEHTLLWMSVILTLAIPTIGIILWIVRRVMKAKSRPIIGYIVASLWFIGIVAGLTLGYKITRKFSTESLQETNILLTSPSTNKLYVEMERYPLDYFSVTPGTSRFTFDSPGINRIVVDNLPFYNVEEDSLLFNRIELRMKTSKDTLFHVKTIFASFDKNYKASKANLREFDFRIEQNDSLLMIPQFFKVPKEQGFRNQFVVVEVYVPSGSKLEVSDELTDYQRPISSLAMRRKYGNDYGYRNSLEWNSDEEYLLEGEKLTETKFLNDSI